MATIDLGSDVRIHITDDVDFETVNVYASFPLSVAPVVWSMADFLKPGTFFTLGSGSRVAAKFGSVDTRDIDSFVNHFANRLTN